MSIPIDERYLATFYAAAQAIADTINKVNADTHEVACENAAKNAIQTGNPPIAVTAARKQKPRSNTFPTVIMDETSEPCSPKTPADYMPAPVQGEVGEGIGALVAGTAKMYYDRTNQHHEPGEVKTVKGVQYKYVRWHPFIGHWERV